MMESYAHAGTFGPFASCASNVALTPPSPDTYPCRNARVANATPDFFAFAKSPVSVLAADFSINLGIQNDSTKTPRRSLLSALSGARQLGGASPAPSPASEASPLAVAAIVRGDHSGEADQITLDAPMTDLCAALPPSPAPSRHASARKPALGFAQRLHAVADARVPTSPMPHADVFGSSPTFKATKRTSASAAASLTSNGDLLSMAAAASRSATLDAATTATTAAASRAKFSLMLADDSKLGAVSHWSQRKTARLDMSGSDSFGISLSSSSSLSTTITTSAPTRTATSTTSGQGNLFASFASRKREYAQLHMDATASATHAAMRVQRPPLARNSHTSLDLRREMTRETAMEVDTAMPPPPPPLKMRRTKTLAPGLESVSSLSRRLSLSPPPAGAAAHRAVPLPTAEPHPQGLPVVEVGKDMLKRISPATLRDLLEGKHTEVCPQFQVIDCRFAYEFAGGHVRNAQNVDCVEALDRMFFGKDAELAGWLDAGAQRPALIFHCEYSEVRAPRLAAHLRKLDRQYNMASYPRLTFPDIYILKGGYNQLFGSEPSVCEPCNYVRMNDADHTEEMRRAKRQHRREFRRCHSEGWLDRGDL